ncbi:hypothetical protein [Aliikangiella maris]|uniref:Uncharacterized protein n=2 Tax=Aliikangiella maris TaxID=3162458 RepID=A0ABV3MQ65_9GAMM
MEVSFNKMKNIFWIVLTICFLSSCNSADECFIADNIFFIENSKLKENNRYLVIRTTGFNKKETFYELYTQKPDFDHCGRSKVEPHFVTHADTTEGRPEKLIYKNDRLDIIYSKSTELFKSKEIAVITE